MIAIISNKIKEGRGFEVGFFLIGLCYFVFPMKYK